MNVSRLLCIVWFAAISPAASALDVRALVEKAVELVDRGQPELARVYLDPALIAPELHATERSRAYYIRGYSYFDQGLYVSARLDYNRALEFNADNPGALVALGDLHRSGHGVPADPGYAFQLYRKAGALGSTVGKVATGRALLLGEGVVVDVAAARRSLAEAAAEGDANAMVHLGASYRMPQVAPAEPEEARKWYLKAAESGATDGLVAIGFMHGNGEFGEPDPAQALAWYQRAADLGLAAGQALVGHAYLQGLGVKADPRQAGRWFERAAAQGDAGAQVALGYLFEAGEGRPASRELARRWYRRAALAGDADGIARYGWLVAEEGDFASQREAVIWLRRLAPADVAATNTVAWILATSNHGDLRDGAEAVRLARLAVDAAPSPALIDTLAAAYAEAGDYSKAVETQQRALGGLPDGASGDRADMQRRLVAYQQGRPWRE